MRKRSKAVRSCLSAIDITCRPEQTLATVSEGVEQPRLNCPLLSLSSVLSVAKKHRNLIMHATLVERKFDRAAAEMLEEPTVRVSIFVCKFLGIGSALTNRCDSALDPL